MEKYWKTKNGCIYFRSNVHHWALPISIYFQYGTIAIHILCFTFDYLPALEDF